MILLRQNRDNVKKLKKYFDNLEKTQGGYFGEDVIVISKDIGAHPFKLG